AQGHSREGDREGQGAPHPSGAARPGSGAEAATSLTLRHSCDRLGSVGDRRSRTDGASASGALCRRDDAPGAGEETVEVNRLQLGLADRHEWVKVFDPRGGGLFVEPPSPPPVGADIRVDLVIEDGPRVILSGTVLWRRDPSPKEAGGCSVGLAPAER